MSVFSAELTVIGWKPEMNSIPLSEKEQCLKSMVDLLSNKGFTNDKRNLFQKLISREKDMSTGIGNQIAIPHVRDKSISNFKAVIYLLDREIDFNSIDGRKVRLIIFFAIPENDSGNYMKTMSKVVEFLRKADNRSQILDCTNSEDLNKSFRRLEDEL